MPKEGYMSDVFHETKIHGKIIFPFAIYKVIIPDFLHNYPLHWHDEFEIIYIQNGTGIIKIQTTEYNCNVGDIFIIPPNFIHGIKQLNNKTMTYFNILFKFSLLEENENSFYYKKYFSPYKEDSSLKTFYISSDNELNKKILPYIESLINNRHEKYSTYELMIKSNLYAILFYVNQLLEPMSIEHRAIHSSMKRLKPILNYIQNNYSQDISIEQASKISNLSESHFMKSFKLLTGMSFINYLNSFRLENAERLLKTTDKSISYICEECGFHYFSYFIRIFKKKYGYTPSAFRNTFI